MAAVQRWCRVRVTLCDGTPVADCVVEGHGAPTVTAIDCLARIALTAKRRGAAFRLTDVSPEMAQLLALSGLSVEMQWQPEVGKQPLGIQHGEEEAHRRDLPS